MNRRVLILIVMLAALLAVGVSTAAAQGGDGDTEPPTVTPEDIAAVASQMTVTAAETVTLDACTLPTCDTWRAEIGAMLEAGQSAEDIIAHFQTTYGVGLAGEEAPVAPAVPPQDIEAVARQLVVDVEAGVLLSDCTSAQCDAWREDISRVLAEGRTIDEATSYMTATYNHIEVGGNDYPIGVSFNDVNGVAHQMFCDVCEGIPLDECESADCRDWRRKISYMIGLGYSDGQIVDYFVENFGADVASLPRDETDRFLVFAIPTALVLLIGLFGTVQVRRLRQRGHQPGQVVRRTSSGRTIRPVPDDLDPALLDRLMSDLEGLES